jgi:potassium efflux system protein
LAKAAITQKALRAERDKLFQQVAAPGSRHREQTSTGVSGPGASEARLLERERLINAELEAAIKSLRLKIAEAKLVRESKLTDVRELHQQIAGAHVHLRQQILDQMQLHYRQLTEAQESSLKRAAANLEDQAHRTDDPLERYVAGRLAMLLELEARILKSEQSLATGTTPSLDEQRALADRAEADYAEIKRLLDDGNVSRLDALRLNNDFRRIGPERERLLRNELVTIEAQLQFYENSLTSVELELLEDSLVDQAEHDAVLDRLAPERHDRARTEIATLNHKQRELLKRQRIALNGLVTRAAQTLEQMTRRRHVLEEEYGFIRTHIFWVRDQEPLGLMTAHQGGRELKRLAKGLFKLAEEAGDRKSWSMQPSSEFLTAAVAAVILPLGLFRVRRMLRRRINRALPPSQLHGDHIGTIRVDLSPEIRKG